MNLFPELRAPSQEYIIGFGEGMYYIVKDNKYEPGTLAFIDYEMGWFDGQEHKKYGSQLK